MSKLRFMKSKILVSGFICLSSALLTSCVPDLSTEDGGQGSELGGTAITNGLVSTDVINGNQGQWVPGMGALYDPAIFQYQLVVSYQKFSLFGGDASQVVDASSRVVRIKTMSDLYAYVLGLCPRCTLVPIRIGPFVGYLNEARGTTSATHVDRYFLVMEEELDGQRSYNVVYEMASSYTNMKAQRENEAVIGTVARRLPPASAD